MTVGPPDQTTTQAYAEAICRRGFGVPALFFLEMYKPLAGVAGIVGEGFHPILGALFGRERISTLTELCKDRESFDRLLNQIEELVSQPAKQEAVDGS